MSYLLLKPYDNLFFRDGKPFDEGTSQWICGMNIPFPSTIYGAIFTHIIRQNPEIQTELSVYKEKFDNKNLNKDEKDKLEKEVIARLKSYLKIKNIYLYDKTQNTVYVPAPLDIFINEEGKVKYGEFIKEEYFCPIPHGNELKLEYLMKNPKDYDRADNYYISILDFINYYAKGKKEEGLLIKEDDIFTKAYKVGIKLNKARTALEEHLYRIDTSEFIDKKFRFLIEYEIENVKLEGGCIKLGGEGRLAELETLDEEFYSIERLKKYYEETEINNEYVKLILTTEGIFKDIAFFPNFEDENIEVVSIVNDKPIHIGGFDMLRKAHKPMMKANRRGCVYILKIKNGKGLKLEQIKEEIKKSINFSEESSFRGFNRFILAPFKGD